MGDVAKKSYLKTNSEKNFINFTELEISFKRLLKKLRSRV